MTINAGVMKRRGQKGGKSSSGVMTSPLGKKRESSTERHHRYKLLENIPERSPHSSRNQDPSNKLPERRPEMMKKGEKRIGETQYHEYDAEPIDGRRPLLQFIISSHYLSFNILAPGEEGNSRSSSRSRSRNSSRGNPQLGIRLKKRKITARDRVAVSPRGQAPESEKFPFWEGGFGLSSAPGFQGNPQI